MMFEPVGYSAGEFFCSFECPRFPSDFRAIRGSAPGSAGRVRTPAPGRGGGEGLVGERDVVSVKVVVWMPSRDRAREIAGIGTLPTRACRPTRPGRARNRPQDCRRGRARRSSDRRMSGKRQGRDRRTRKRRPSCSRLTTGSVVELDPFRMMPLESMQPMRPLPRQTLLDEFVVAGGLPVAQSESAAKPPGPRAGPRRARSGVTNDGSADGALHGAESKG